MGRIETCVLAAGLALSLAAGAASDTRTSAWSDVGCDVFALSVEDGSGVACGYVTVPLRHDEPGGASIALATVILPATAPTPRPDPLFIAQGGPGGSTIGTYAEALLANPEIRPTTSRDLVLWDQRGTLHSKPALLCPELGEQLRADAGSGASEADSMAASIAAARACGRRLAEETGDLSAFNSAENAHDVEALRLALGYEAINFYGVSYGTELGQFLMRQHPGPCAPSCSMRWCR